MPTSKRTKKKTNIKRRVKRKRASPDANQAVGRRLARIRRDRGLSQRELADRLGVGQPVVSNYERGARGLSSELIIRIAGILEVSADELLGLKSSKTNGRELRQPFLRRLRKVDTLSQGEQRALLQTIDAFLTRAEVRKSTAA